MQYYLDMPPYDFDQSDNGWRSLSNYREKYEAIIEYLDINLDEKGNWKNGDDFGPFIMYFHVAQCMAQDKREVQACEYLVKAYKDKIVESNLRWNLYVQATEFFLLRQKRQLQELYDEHGKNILNWKIIRNMLNNFHKTYYEVYRIED